MTILDVGLSKTLQGELAQPGVSAYAVWFDANEATPQWTILVDDGAIENSGTVAVALPDPMEGGKVYFIIQSGSAGSVDNLPALITQQSDLNWSNAALYDFSYDSFEVTLSNTSSDVGNLSSINGFALPIGVSVPFTNGTTATVGYGVSGAEIASAIQAINPSAVSIYDFDSGPLQGQFRMALSPTIAVTPDQMLSTPVPFNDADWAAYVTSLEGPRAANIVLSGLFNGAKDANGVWHNGGLFAYQLSWDAAASTFLLDPLAGSQIQGDIRITPDQLEQSIYSTLGTVDIYSGGSVYLADMNTGLNNQWGKVLSEFLTGFTGGFYGTAAHSPNPQINGTVDLDQNINWDPSYAFGQMVAPDSQPPVADDAYSRIFYTDTNSYGSGYSDALMSQYALGGPQIPVVEPGTSTDVPAIDLTIYANNEMPTPDSAFGYTAPVIYDYIAPPAAQGGIYATPDDTTSGANIGFDFASSVANNAGVVLAASDTVTLGILTSDTGGHPVWDTITLDGALAGPLGLWQRWDITGSAGSYVATPTPNAEPAGSLLITSLPIADQGVVWYEIGVGDKVFDLYTTSLNGQFENPNFVDSQGDKAQAGALAVDGLAQVIAPVYAPTPQTILTFTVDFTPNDTVAFDPSLLVANTANADTVHPVAPVAGSLVDGSFVALAGQSNLVSNSITTGASQLAFAWTGENDSAGAGTPSWISGYTNKIDAGDIARITLTPQNEVPITTTATADIDGQWQTGEIDLGNGTYTVTMQAFLPDDTSFAHPLTETSGSLILTETGTGDEQACFLSGTRIATPRGQVLVASLAVGDLVLTRNGRVRPVTWIGHSRVHVSPGRRTAATPVLIRRGALADGIPNRDLRITKGHSLYLDGALIPAEFLVNHRSIVWDDRAQTVDIFHIELPDHDVLLANAAAAESYRDDGNRWLFHNAHTGWDQPPKPPCAPVLTGGALVDAIWHRLLRRSRLWLNLPTADVSDLHLNADGVRVDGRDCGQGLFLFRLPNPPNRLRIMSRAAAPDKLGVARDPRVLGVALRRIAMWQGASVRLLDMTEPGLQDGFHAFEPDNMFRWTNGNALLPAAFLSGLTGACELELTIGRTGLYPQHDQPQTKAA